MNKTCLYLAFTALIGSHIFLSAVSAEVRHVPGQFATLQEAIDASNPNDVILVAESTQDSIVINKPIKIIGDSIFWVTQSSCSNAGITLAGPGGGEVILANVIVDNQVDCPAPPSPLSGTGFLELRLYDAFLNSWDSGISGFSLGSPAIDIDVPRLMMKGGVANASSAAVNSCTYGFLYADGETGIKAPNTDVIMMDNYASGGSPVGNCCYDCQPCPPSTQYVGGEGGTAILAKSVHYASTFFFEGSGGPVYIDNPKADPTHCFYANNGVQFEVQYQHEWPNDLNVIANAPGPGGFGEASLGGTITLAPINVPSTFVVLAGAPIAPLDLGKLGKLAVDPMAHINLGIYTVTQFNPTVTYTIPNDPALIGTELMFQTFDLENGLSRPSAVIITP